MERAIWGCGLRSLLSKLGHDRRRHSVGQATGASCLVVSLFFKAEKKDQSLCHKTRLLCCCWANNFGLVWFGKN